MQKNHLLFRPIAIIGALVAMTHSAWALQVLDEQTLSQTTGQDGLTVKISNNTGQIKVASVSLIDKDGFAGATAAGALSYVPTASGGGGVQFFNGTTLLSGSNNPLVIMTADTDAGVSNKAFLNLNIAFNNRLSRINFTPFALGLTAVDSAGKTIQAGRKDIIRTGTSGVDVLLNTARPLGMNIQLGNQPQGAMALLHGSINEIRADGLQLMSYTNDVTDNNIRSVQLDVNIKANAASTNGIGLDGTYLTVKPTGLEIGNKGTIDKFDVGLNNITMGQSGGSAAGTFDGLKNGSMGSFGATGVAITGFKMNVSGL